eukprot:TRINITY_DN890_c0_g1_i1.p1 TRINITY_DN890_c0_g1~~TRINITY_DN890_c0_g1_i1.p1  ORF type:complete len:303 (+),score=57.40 TRINITY_DN890_c0_g1_i1:43-951(+)
MTRGGKNGTYTHYVAVLEKDAKRLEIAVHPECPFRVTGVRFDPNTYFPEQDDQGNKARIPAFCHSVRPERLVVKPATGEASILLDLREFREKVKQLLQLPEADPKLVLLAVLSVLASIGETDEKHAAEFQGEFLYWYFFDPLVKARGEEAGSSWCHQGSDVEAIAIAKLQKRGSHPTQDSTKLTTKTISAAQGNDPSLGSSDSAELLQPPEVMEPRGLVETGAASIHEARSLLRPKELPRSNVARAPEQPTEDPMRIQPGAGVELSWAEEAEAAPYLMDFPPPVPDYPISVQHKRRAGRKEE